MAGRGRGRPGAESAHALGAPRLVSTRGRLVRAAAVAARVYLGSAGRAVPKLEYFVRAAGEDGSGARGPQGRRRTAAVWRRAGSDAIAGRAISRACSDDP